MTATPKQLASLRKAREAKARKNQKAKRTSKRTTTKRTTRKRALSGVAESKPNMNSALREMIRVKNILSDSSEDRQANAETLRSQCSIAADRIENAISYLQVAITSIAQ